MKTGGLKREEKRREKRRREIEEKSENDEVHP